MFFTKISQIWNKKFLNFSKRIIKEFTHIKPRLFLNFGKNLPIKEDEEIGPKKSSISPIPIQERLVKIDFLMDQINKTLNKIKALVKAKRYFLVKPEIDVLLSLCHEQQKNILNENFSKIDILISINEKLLKELPNLSFSLKNNVKIYMIFDKYIQSFVDWDRYNYKEKGILIELISDFLTIVFQTLDLEVFKEILNKYIPFGTELNIDYYRSNIANKSTLSFYIELGFIPNSFTTYLKSLEFELNQGKGDEIYQNKIKIFFNKFLIQFKNNPNIDYLDNLFSNERKIKEVILKFKNLHQYNEFIHYLFFINKFDDIKFYNQNIWLFELLIKQLMESFPMFLINSPIQTIMFFTLLSSVKNCLGGNRLIPLQIFNFLLKKIQNFSQFLSIFSILIMSGKNFILIDGILKEFYEYSLIYRYSLNSVEILQFIKLTKYFYELSHENNYIYSLLTAAEDILRKDSEKLSIEDKFQVICFLESIDIPSKKAINTQIIQNLDKCPQKLLSKILIHICDFSYNFVNFDELEKLVMKNYETFDFFEKLLIFKSFIYHLQGSQKFITRLLEDCIENLGFNEKAVSYKNVAIHQLCHFYQIVFTLKGFYKDNYVLLENEHLKAWYSKFQSKYDEYDQPFYPKRISFSKEEFELDLMLKTMKISFVKEKKILLHKVDFFIENRLCLELYGRHHFASKIIIDGKTKWKERNLKEKSGYDYKTISIEKWKISSHEAKIKMIHDILKK